MRALWEPRILDSRGVALGLVCLACLFDVLWVSIATSIHHKNYDMPSPVRYLTSSFTFCSPLMHGLSIGAGSALLTWVNALVVNTSGYG